MKNAIHLSLIPIIILVLMSQIVASSALAQSEQASTLWNRHTIDNSSSGADGIRVHDVNEDGWPDLVTGWEEGSQIRIYLHPGKDSVKMPWPSVTVGEVGSPEDAVFVDLDGDGSVDVISSCEGNVKSVFVHWAPSEKEQYMQADAWETEAIPELQNKQAWMFCLPMQVDGKHGIDLVIGSKGDNAQVGWLQAPESPRNLDEWTWHPLIDAQWIMSIRNPDMDKDGDDDLLITDRKGEKRSTFWLENPGFDQVENQWKRFQINREDHEFMFLDYGDVDFDGMDDAAVATKDNGILLYRQNVPGGKFWDLYTIGMPENTGSGKAVGIGDIDLDGKTDLVFTCEHAEEKRGIMGFRRTGGNLHTDWEPFDIAGLEGTKFDLIQLLDADNDGDLDLFTCEERENLGVIWYENPTQ